MPFNAVNGMALRIIFLRPSGPCRWVSCAKAPAALLPRYAHAVAHRREAALNRALLVHLDETFEADAHHAVRRASALRDGRGPAPAFGLPQQHGGDALPRLGGDRPAIHEDGEGGRAGIMQLSEH